MLLKGLKTLLWCLCSMIIIMITIFVRSIGYNPYFIMIMSLITIFKFKMFLMKSILKKCQQFFRTTRLRLIPVYNNSLWQLALFINRGRFFKTCSTHQENCCSSRILFYLTYLARSTGCVYFIFFKYNYVVDSSLEFISISNTMCIIFLI